MQRTNEVVFGVSAALLACMIACSEENGGSSPGTPGGTSSGGTSSGAGGRSVGGSSGVGAGGTATGGVAGSGTGGAAGTGMGGAAGTGTGGATGGAAGTGTGGATGGTAGMGGSAGNPPQCNASAAPQVGRLGLTPVVNSGLTGLLYAAQPPGSSDWYLVERGGRVLVWTGGALRPTPFLNLSSEIQVPASYDERGLFSLAFAPDYATSGLFYVVLTPTTGTTANRDLVLEYRRSSADPFVADAASRRALLDLAPGGSAIGILNQVHNGGTIAFGPDGMLYVGMGDGGGACNSARPGVPQDVSTVYGKILRLDPKAAAPHPAAGNPFMSGGDARVYHYGLRNPFRFSFDSTTGDLYIGNVGQESFDEIEFAAKGASGLNFGWPDFEGTDTNTCPSGTPLRSGSTHTPPIHIINGTSTTSLVIAVMGGAVYRGTTIPRLYGAYVFGEYYPGRPMGALFRCGTQTSPVTTFRKQCDPNTPNDPCFAAQNGAAGLSELGAIIAGNDNELYVVANGTSLLKVVPAP